MVDGEIVTAIRELADRGWGAKAIARELAVARNTVRRYLRQPVMAGHQVRSPRRLTADVVHEVETLYTGVAERNAVVVHRLLREQGRAIGLRTVQRAVAPVRQAQRAADVATVRVETAPGAQLQIDFGEKRVVIAGTAVRVFLLIAVLSYSRRLFVKAFLNERQDDWREGIASAFVHFGGVTATVLGDNARALVLGRDRATGTIHFHPAYLAFCRDWGVQPRACAPYRARTKGKTESGVKYVKRNALAGRSFESFSALEHHLTVWMAEADRRVHGTTHEAPLDRFVRDEQAALRSLPARPLPRREQRLRRRVAQDAFVDVETVRYSVPYHLVREHVDVAVGDDVVQIFHGTTLVATHRRVREPYARVLEPAHVAGLWRVAPTDPIDVVPLAALGRSLDAYADAIGGAQ
ncbi:MAG TPA: IS21 family transposase [Vicinamibacterales bacterium]|nr:IS21 family transposase [Vicinamibacterales bacterium]